MAQPVSLSSAPLSSVADTERRRKAIASIPFVVCALVLLAAVGLGLVLI